MKVIPVAGPWITQKEIDYVADAAASAWYENANKYHERFERAFAEYVNTTYAVALNSCTAAIHLSLMALGIGPGDEVIVPDITWIASAAPITYVGATPVFADIEPDTWCLSCDSFEKCISDRTRAVIPVDLYGGMPDMAQLLQVAARRNVAVIEDAAEAIGSEYSGRRAGSFGDVGVFSFHGSKTLTTGEGGMLVTNREDLFRRVLFLRDHGRNPGDTMFCNTEVAYKYKMSSMQAAIGLAQTERLHELIMRKREIFDWYRAELENVEGLTLNAEPPNVTNSYWMVTVILGERFGLQKEQLIERLAEQGIGSRPFFNPLSALPAFSGNRQADEARRRNKTSYALGPYGVNLPSGFNMTAETVQTVCDKLKHSLGLR